MDRGVYRQLGGLPGEVARNALSYGHDSGRRRARHL